MILFAPHVGLRALLAASGIESLLVFLLVILFSVVSNWLKRRAQAAEEETWRPEQPAPPSVPPERPNSSGRDKPAAPVRPLTSPAPAPGPAPMPPPRKTIDWEEELRRLLGEPVEPPPPVVVADRPPPRQTAPPSGTVPEPPSPPPRRASQPVLPRRREPGPTTPPPTLVASMPHAGRPASATPATRPSSAPGHRSWAAVTEEAGAPVAPLAELTQSSSGYQRAIHLHDRVADRLHQIDQQTERHAAVNPPGHPRRFSAEIAEVRALLRRPQSARQAVVASVLLGPPKGLE